MNSVISQSAAESLIFGWDSPRGEKLAITIFLALSLIAHALCFYIFQIAYPPTVALLPPPARITLISPDNSESLALLRWVEAEDPALATTTQRTAEAQSLVLPPAEHRPLSATPQPILRPL